MAVVRSLNAPDDVVLSNHRNHGHFMIYSGHFIGLVAEIMGRKVGVCGGYRGSQHLAFRHFHSNGVQGGMTGIGTGLALARKMGQTRALVATMIGDGPLGEGLLYESMNPTSVWKAAVLFVVENNGSAQSTYTHETIGGSIQARDQALVSGYEIHPEFAAAIDRACLEAFAPTPNVPALWLEQAAPDFTNAAPASQKVVDAWRAGGANIDVRFFEGPNFWQVAERAVATSAVRCDHCLGKTNLANRMNETAILFECDGDPLVGVVHGPDTIARRGILIAVAGGAQYRVGGHRQLVLWARRMAKEGYGVFRFDYRGWGDSHAEFHDFDEVDNDIRAALDHFKSEVPELEEIVLWGECNPVSAILFYAYRDERVKGLVLLNPWVRTVEGQAKAILRYYYLSRLMVRSLWKKILSGRFNPVKSIGSALNLIGRLRANSSTTSPAALNSRPMSSLGIFRYPIACLPGYRGSAAPLCW